MESLYPEERKDKGRSRVMDEEADRRPRPVSKGADGSHVAGPLERGESKGHLPARYMVSYATIYRIFKRHGVSESDHVYPDRRRFEAELPNDIWQSDGLHGPRALHEGKMKKTYCFAFIDDMSRLIPHAEFYLNERIDCYIDALAKALSKRGLPRKLYVDNGPAFSTQVLRQATASLGIALIHSTPYQPEGRGKVEGFFRTVRGQFLSTIPDGLSLDALNKRLMEWIDEYHLLPDLDPDDRALALMHGLAFVAREHGEPGAALSRQPARRGGRCRSTRLVSWYRRFIDTRSSRFRGAHARNRNRRHRGPRRRREAMMFAATTDHVFIDGGHTLDFTNKAFEALDHLGKDAAPDVLPTLVLQTDVGATLRRVLGVAPPPQPRAARRRRLRSARRAAPRPGGIDVGRLGVGVARRRSGRGDRRARRRPRRRARPTKSSAAPSRTPPRCASCASTCRTTTATGTPCITRSRARTRCIKRCNATPLPSCGAAVCTPRLRIYLDRFLNVPAARLPHAETRQSRRDSPSASKRRAWSTRPATRRTASCRPAVPAPS